MTSDNPEIEIPAESVMLKADYKKSGLTVADLASATGLSVGTIHIALSGIRYRDGKGKAAVPPDRTLVKLASVLLIDSEALRAYERDRAAELLEEAGVETSQTEFSSDLEAQAAVAGRAALTRQILAAFSTEELRAEINRRERRR